MLSDNIILIDDTYNGNSNGIHEGIKLLEKFKGRRKVYITPGLVETGSLSESIHLEIGAELSSVANLVVLIKNSVTPFIEKGLLENGFDKENIIWFDDAKTTYSSLRSFVKEGDVVMMQNDWSDNYS
jgi:UDP-N-acetylmuramyl pentapeptide synthase